MDNAVQVDMTEWLAVKATALDTYYQAMKAGGANNQTPVKIKSEDHEAAVKWLVWCRFSRLPQNVGELEVFHRVYHAFTIIEKHNYLTDYGLGEELEYVRATYPRLFADAKQSHRAMHPPIRMFRDGKMDDLEAWLTKNDTLAVWSTKPDSFYKF